MPQLYYGGSYFLKTTFNTSHAPPLLNVYSLYLARLSSAFTSSTFLP